MTPPSRGRRGTEGSGGRRRPCAGTALPEWVVPLPLPTPYPIGPVTTYLLRGEPLTLIDTGPATRAAWHALVAGLAKVGHRPEDVRRVLLTHGHHDHFGQARRLARRGALVHAHPDERSNLRLERRYGELLRQLRLAGVSLATRLALAGGLVLLDATARRLPRAVPLADGEVLEHSRGRLRVHHLPGHSPGHVGFELIGEGVMWTGDVLLAGITPNAVVGPDPHEPRKPFLSLAAYNASLAKIVASGVRRLLPGHGPCIDDVAGAVREVLHRQELRARQIRRLLERRPAQVATLLRQLFPGLAPVETFLAFSEVFGHLLELERRGEVVRLRQGRRELWSLAR